MKTQSNHLDAFIRQIRILQMGLFEAPAIFSIIVLLLTGNNLILIQVTAVLLVLIVNRSSSLTIKGELGLDRD